MTVYVVAQFTIDDRARYQRYTMQFMSVLKKYDGRLLASQENPEVVEGVWPNEKIVMLSFTDHAAFDGWSQSAEYQEISKDRVAATRGSVLLVPGA
jgi:uncharacterized protein (DUF1330 family)